MADRNVIWFTVFEVLLLLMTMFLRLIDEPSVGKLCAEVTETVAVTVSSTQMIF